MRRTRPTSRRFPKTTFSRPCKAHRNSGGQAAEPVEEDTRNGFGTINDVKLTGNFLPLTGALTASPLVAFHFGQPGFAERHTLLEAIVIPRPRRTATSHVFAERRDAEV